MALLLLPTPDEPRDLRTAARRRLEQAPQDGLRWLAAGDWIIAPLWEEWRAALEPRGVDREDLRWIVVGYRSELRLWVMGERPWDQCVAGLIGRVARRCAGPD